MHSTLDQLSQDIRDVSELVDLLAADVARCPTFKRTTRFYLDRVAELERLRAKLAGLYAAQDRLLATSS
jgi:hypothetical protein